MSDELKTEKQEVEVSGEAERTRAARVYVPQVDIFTEDETIVIVADMPGVAENDVDITVDKDVLSISGLVTAMPEVPEGYEMVRAEYGIGDYQRSFTLPDEVDRNKIEAVMSNGVLRVTLPKAPEAQVKKIAVKTG